MMDRMAQGTSNLFEASLKLIFQFDRHASSIYHSNFQFPVVSLDHDLQRLLNSLNLAQTLKSVYNLFLYRGFWKTGPA